jgi:DNA-binding transcriptional regulator/RsmH inhibitor MraZ
VVNQANPELRTTPPQGHLTASVDGAGRLNTPGRAQEYFTANGVEEFFCTTLDERIALIYPLSVWLQHIAKMAATPGKAASAQRLSFLGNANGDEVKADKTGRILLPSNLRAKIPLEKQSVVLTFYSGYAKLMTKAVHEAEELAAKSHLAEDLDALRDEGLY